MQKSIIFLFVCVFLFPAFASASEYDIFSKDLIKPYGLFKKSLALTSKKDDLDKAKETTKQFVSAWEGFAEKYAKDVPTPFKSIEDFAGRIRKPSDIAKAALSALEAEDVAKAHSVLEEIRYILWDMRVRAGIVSLNDKINDFHEAMEIVLEKIGTAKDSGDLMAVYERYGAWFSIKWEEIFLTKDYGTEGKTYDEALKEGRDSIRKLNDAMKAGNKDAALKLSSSVKNSYKKLFFMPI
ncbi:MAG: hypothetical protein Q8K68_07955 [Nitrospirota bacterium]|nr:hypothetical protein [Nitrospirota bacterium]